MTPGRRWVRWLAVALLPVLAAFALQWLDAITSDERRAAKAASEKRALLALLPESATPGMRLTRLPALPSFPELERVAVYDGERAVATAWMNWKALDGYAGPIRLAVVFDGRGAIRQVSVLGHRETPGLGDRVTQQHGEWLGQFASLADAHALRTRRAGGRIDALTGATVTSVAITRGVRAAFEARKALLGDGVSVGIEDEQ